MPTRRFTRSDQNASRYSGSVVLSIGAAILMIICLIVVIILGTTQNHAPTVPRSETDERGQFSRFMEQLSLSYNNYLVPAKLQETLAMKVEQERGDLATGTSGDVFPLDQSMCPFLENVKEKDANCLVSGTVCDCSSQQLTQVPTSLAEHVQCTILLLNDNCLMTLPSGAFADFTELEILDLGDNRITELNTSTFQGLSKLQSLSLRHNYLPMDGSFPPGIFQNLSSLTSLDISGNNDDLTADYLQYPGEALSDLENLQELAIDGLYEKKFPDQFAFMESLHKLNLGGPYENYCRIGTINYDTFQNVPHLKTLNISHCHLTNIYTNNCTFDGLTNLMILDISWNEKFGIANVSTLLVHLPNETILTHLNVSHVTPSYAKSSSISSDLVQALPKGLKLLAARGNSFESVDGEVFEMLPINLTYLDVSDNRFVFGAYLTNMSRMTNLETLLLNGANVVYNVPKSYPTNKPSGCSATCLPSLSESGNTSDKLIFQLPPKLKRLSMIKAGLSYRLTEISVNSNNSLEELSLDLNVFPLLEGPLYGLHKLKFLSMASCFTETIKETFFQNLTSLEKLDISYNQIGLGKLSEGNVTLFDDLGELKYLNLSFNSLPEMNNSQNFLKGLDNLEELYLQNNRLWNFNMDISHLHKLRVLNLSSNFLSSLNSDVTSYIHSLVMKSNTSINVDLCFNFFKCDCNNLDFLRWMSSSKALNESLSTDMYLCVFPQFQAAKIINDSYLSVIDHLTRECTPKYGLFLFSLFGTLLLTSFVLGLILYRFRWNLRYMYYAAYLSVKKRHQPVVIEEDYPYDVFLSYARPDEEFILDTLCPALETRGLKLHVHGRDFVAGDYIASNIVTAVKESRKTLVILTRALLESTWCNYEIQMANMESVHTGRPVLIFLMKESVSNRQLGQNLLSHIRNNTYIPYPESVPAQEPGNHLLEAFWDKLAVDLKS